MKFASLLTSLSLSASAFAVYVTSPDGTKIWAEATGNPNKPAVVFVPGFSCSSLAFNKQWSDPSMTENLYMVWQFRTVVIEYSYLSFNRFVMMFEVRALATNLSPIPPTPPNPSLMISKPLSTTSVLERKGQFLLGGI